MHAYLIGTGILGSIYLYLYLARMDLRKAMIWSGLFNIALLTMIFIILRIFIYQPLRAITPGYWSPPTLFNLGQITGGYAIEDVLFMFFSAGIAAAGYEFIFRAKLGKRSDRRLKKRHAVVMGLICGLTVYIVFPVNAIYMLISFQFFGALALMWQRRDLIAHSAAGGFIFLLMYGFAFYSFNLLFPSFVGNYYNLNYTSHIFLLNIPLEEYLYALSFGMIWAPIYEYEHRIKDRKLRRSGLRKFVLAAGATRR